MECEAGPERFFYDKTTYTGRKSFFTAFCRGFFRNSDLLCLRSRKLSVVFLSQNDLLQEPVIDFIWTKRANERHLFVSLLALLRAKVSFVRRGWFPFEPSF